MHDDHRPDHDHDLDAPFRWAILGTGAVARKFVLGLGRPGPAGHAQVVASRDREHAARLAGDLGVPEVAGSYLEAIEREGIDAVYVATPPSTHRDLALAAIAAGRAVLVEKPFAMDAGEADEIARAARAAGVFCMEGMWTRFAPLLAELRSRLAGGSLGEIRCFEASFCGPVVVDPRQSLFDPALGGGALMHRGVYPLSLARDLFGPVTDITATARPGPTGVDEEVVVVLRHERGTLSCLRASIAAPGRNDMAIFGTAGAIHVEAPIYRPWAMRETRVRPDRGAAVPDPRREALRESAWAQGSQQRARRFLSLLRRARDDRTVAHYAGNGYGAEAHALVRDVRAGRTESSVMPIAQSVEVMDLIDRARASASVRPVAPTVRGERSA